MSDALNRVHDCVFVSFISVSVSDALIIGCFQMNICLSNCTFSVIYYFKKIFIGLCAGDHWCDKNRELKLSFCS